MSSWVQEAQSTQAHVTRAPVSRWAGRVTLGAALAVLLWAPLAQGSTFGWGQTGLILLGALSGLLLSLHALWIPRSGRASLFALPATLLLVWIWASVGWSPERYEALRWAGSWTALLCAALTVERCADSARRRATVIGTLVLAAGLCVGVAALQARGVFLPGLTTMDPTQRSGTFFNPSHFSGYLIGSAALLSSFLLLRRPSLWGLPVLAILVVLEAVNLKTDSSSIPAVLLATVLPLLTLVWTRNRAAGIGLTVLGLVAAAAVTAAFFTPQGQALFAREQARIGIHRDWGSFLKQRQAVWHYGQSMVREHPLLGVGIGQFQAEAPRYRRAERDVGSGMDRAGVNYAHNDALQMASELGLPGAALFFAALLLPLVRRGGFAWLTWWAALPPLLLAGLYDAHLSAIPGTAAGMLALAALAATSAHRSARTTPVAPRHQPRLESQPASGTA